MCIFAIYNYSCGHPCFTQRQWARCPHLTYPERQPNLVTPCPDLRRTLWRVHRWCTSCTVRARREGRHVPEPAKGKLRRKVCEKLRVECWQDGQWVQVKLEDATEDKEPMERELVLATLSQEYVPADDSKIKDRHPTARYKDMSIDEMRERFKKSTPHDREKRVRILSPESGILLTPGNDTYEIVPKDPESDFDMKDFPTKERSVSVESEEV